MLKKRVFLMGLGAGIIIGALLFQLMLSGEESRQRLNDLGKESEQKLYTQLEVDALLKANQDSLQLNQETKTDKESQEPKPAAKADPVKEQTSEALVDKAAPTVVPAKEQPAAKHVIRIEAGSGLTKTAELLASNHIIQDKTAFISKMKKSKKLVRAGYFLFQEEITVDEAILVVTSQPLTKEEVNLLTASKKAS
jgi:mannose-1-phosphate guanylyltransferase